MRHINVKKRIPFLANLTVTEMIALGLFAILGESSKYDLFIKAGEEIEKAPSLEKTPSYSAFHRSVNSLLEKQLIEVTKVQPSAKNRKIEVEFYKLTLAGVIKVLLPLFDKYRWRESKELYDYALELVGGLLKNYPEMCSRYKLKGDDGVYIGEAVITYNPEDRTCGIDLSKLGASMSSLSIEVAKR